jgi:hypothetical protein
MEILLTFSAPIAGMIDPLSMQGKMTFSIVPRSMMLLLALPQN